MSDLLGVPEEKVNEDRLYRALDTRLPLKKGLVKLPKERLGELFDLGLRPAALRHHQHILRGTSGRQPAGAAGLFAGSSPGLQAGAYRVGGEPLQDPLGL